MSQDPIDMWGMRTAPMPPRPPTCRFGRAAGLAALALISGAEPALAVDGHLSGLSVPGLSPDFSPANTQYSIPRTAACSIPVVATLADPSLKLHVQSGETASGATRNAWVCDGKTKIDIVVYQVWNEVGRYTVTVLEPGTPAPDPEPTPDPAPPPAPEPTQDPEPPVGTVPDPDTLSDARLLAQATFGPTPDSLAELAALGRDAWLAAQVALPESQVPDGLDVNQLRAKVFLNMATGEDRVRQRAIFALSQVLVVSTGKNTNGYELIPWVRMLSANAFGNYRDLLRQVTLSPTMGKYLDLANSRKSGGGSAPNENFPRELMQLFTVGLWELEQDGDLKLDSEDNPIPTYNQAAIRELARALTGWTYPTAPGASPQGTNAEYFVGEMEPRPEGHDSGAKTLLRGQVLPAGQSPGQDLEGVLDNLFNHPNMAPFLATRLIRALVGSNPSRAYIERVADRFDDNGEGVRGDLLAVLTAVLTDPEASAPSPTERARLKDPIQYFIGLGRALGASVGDPSQFLYLFSNLGQLVLSPPSVFGFYSPLAGVPGHPGLYGPEFQIYTPSLAIQRANLVYGVLSGQFGSAFHIDLAPFTALAGDPPALVDKVSQVLLQGAMSPGLRQILLDATVAVPDAQQRAIGALYLAALSDEYQVQR